MVGIRGQVGRSMRCRAVGTGVWLAVAVLAASALVAGPKDAAQSTVITSESLVYDYKRMIADFEGRVVVRDPDLQMTCDRLTVRFESDNSLQSITAQGNVRMKQAEKTASCDRAVYTVKTGEIVLTGNAALTRAGDTLRGKQIKFWRNQERMECTPGYLVITPKSQDARPGAMLP